MRILSHYFVARFLGLFATALLATLILLTTVELVLNLDDLSSSAAGPANPASPGSPSSPQAGPASTLPLLQLAQVIGVRLASYYLPDVIPIASFAAGFIAFAWAGRAMELVAIQAGGIRLARVVFPVLGAALILSLASGILHETLILRAEQIWNLRVAGTETEIDFGRQAFWYHKGRSITNITKADASTRTLFGVEIFERGADGSVVRVVRAERVRIEADGAWRIQAARIWDFDPLFPAAPPRLTEHAEIVLDLEPVAGDALLGADPALLPLPSLARYLEARTDDSASTHRRLVNRYHERLSQPWLVLLFAFLAVPFGLRVDRTGHIIRPAVAAIALVGCFFLVRSAGVTLTQQELLPVGLSPWLSMAVFAVATAIALRRNPI